MELLRLVWDQRSVILEGTVLGQEGAEGAACVGMSQQKSFVGWIHSLEGVSEGNGVAGVPGG